VKDAPILFSAPMVRALLEGRKTQTRRALKLQPIPFAIDEAGTLCDVSLMHVDWEPWPRIWMGRDKSGVLTTQQVRFAAGQRLWVKEGHTRFDKGSCDQHVWYRAGGNLSGDAVRDAWLARFYPDVNGDEPWPHALGPAGGAPYQVASIHMPRWASRLTLLVTDVRVERLHDISEADAIAEGVGAWHQSEAVLGNDRRSGQWVRSSVQAAAQRGETRPTAATNVGAFRMLWNEIHQGPDAWATNPWVVAVSFRVHKNNIDELSPAIVEAAK